jgi:hypothetical protein|tara:strand:- start:637 stop:1377 length:741 start_codon:yes stop_codon:yes gene_type:complete
MALRDQLTKEIELRLGGQMVDVELDPEHYELSMDKSFEKYRQRSENAVEEAFVALNLLVDQAEYTLDNEVIEVKDVYRRSSGTLSSASSGDIEPFETAYLNNFLLYSGRAGGLGIYDALAQHREHLSKMFGGEYTFTWNTVTKKLLLHRKIKAPDTVFIHVYKQRNDEELLTDPYSSPWIKEYALAHAKLMLAEARGKFNTIAGPQGGTSLNADALRNDALTAMDKLEDDLKYFADGQAGLGVIIG